MSRGIHAVLEARQLREDGASGWWTLASDPDIDWHPNKVLFGLLARDPGDDYASYLAQTFDLHGLEVIAGPRGVPTDSSLTMDTLREQWGDSAEDVSWVTCDELASTVERLHAAFRQTKGINHDLSVVFDVGVSVRAILAYLAVYQANGYETRIIFFTAPF